MRIRDYSCTLYMSGRLRERCQKLIGAKLFFINLVHRSSFYDSLAPIAPKPGGVRAFDLILRMREPR